MFEFDGFSFCKKKNKKNNIILHFFNLKSVHFTTTNTVGTQNVV